MPLKNIFETVDDTTTQVHTKTGAFLISTIDIAKVSEHYWGVSVGVRNGHEHWYVSRKYRDENNVWRSSYLSRFLMKAENPFKVDHINGDRLDNRRENLRICTNAENTRNKTRKSLKSSSQFKGVSYDRQRSIWISYIYVCSKHKYLGSFADETDAAEAYNKAAILHFGEFACLNEIR